MRLRAHLVIVAAALACAVGAGVASAAPSAPGVAIAARTCKPPSYPGSGYFTSLRVSRVTCTTGRRVALAHYRCRVKHGRAGHCTTTVLHFRCKEQRNSIPTEIDSLVTCTYGSRRVVFSYQQNL